MTKYIADRMLFCPNCNWAEARVIVEQSKIDLLCRNCEGARFSEFYSFGSLAHKWICAGEFSRLAGKDWQKGDKTIKAFSFPGAADSG